MLNEPTLDNLRSMRLTGMADAWLAQQQEPECTGLSFDERFALLVQAEELYRENRRLKRLMRVAKLRIPSACIEGVRCSLERGLQRSSFRQLATGSWMQQRQSLLITGKTGTGKTYLACAFGHHACRNGRRTLYRRLTLLLRDFLKARADGTYTTLVRNLGRLDLLIIDDWGIPSLDEVARRDLLELFDARYGLGSTVLTSQLPVKHWHEYIGEPTVADAILDRLVHNAHRVELVGPSQRGSTTQPASTDVSE